jgi:hypothetical protein
VLLRDLNVSLDKPQEALEAVRATLVGLSQDSQTVSHPGIFGSDVRVRHIIGLDPAKRGVAVAQAVEVGMNLAFCQRNVAAARSDLVRICAEIREELESQTQPEEMLGAAWGDNAGLAELADRSFQYAWRPTTQTHRRCDLRQLFRPWWPALWWSQRRVTNRPQSLG